MHQVLALLTAVIFSYTMLGSENPLEKIFLLSLHKSSIILPKITHSIKLFALTSIIQSMPERIKILNYLAHQEDDHQQTLFRTIYSCDAQIIDSIIPKLFPPQFSLFNRYKLCRGDFLSPQEYSSQNTKDEILFLKYQKVITSLVHHPVIQYAYHQNQKEIELRISKILKVNEEKTELNIKKLLDSHGNEKLKNIILGVDFSGPCDELSPTIQDLLLRSSFSVEDTTILFNLAMIVTAYESEKNKGLFLNKLLKNFIDKHHQKSVDDKCRFIVIFTLLFHHRYLPKAYQTNYITSLFDNINDFFPTTIKPTQSHVSYIDDLHGTEYEPTALHYACKFKLFNLINLILQKDEISISLNKQNHAGQTPLMLLCKHYFPYDHFGVDDYLYSLSTKIEVFIDIMKQCIKKGADLSIHDNTGKTIVHHIFENIFGKNNARHSDNEDFVANFFSLLNFLDHSIATFMNQKDNNDNTAFHFFISNVAYMKFSDENTIKLIHYFLSRNNNISHPNKKNRTPLQMYLGSVTELNWDVICFLMSQGSALYWPHTEIEINYSRMNKGPLIYSKKFKNQMPFKTIVSFIEQHAYTGKPEEAYRLQIEEKIESHIKLKEDEWKQLLGPISVDTETFKKKQSTDVSPQKNCHINLLQKYLSFFFKLFHLSFFFYC